VQALVFDGTLRFVADFPEPKVGHGEVLIKVIQAGVCSTDLEIVRGYLDFSGIIGHEFVGIVVKGSAELAGRRVVGEINCVCHRCDMCQRGLENHCRNRTVLGIVGRNGAFAEYVTLPSDNLHVLPAEITDDQAVFVEPVAAALQVKQQFQFRSDYRAAILGAGRLGLLVAQVVKPLVGEFKLFSRSTTKRPVCNQLGLALEPIDSAQSGVLDVVIDCTGSPEGFASAQKLLRPRGTIILKSTYAAENGPNPALTVINELQIIGSRCGPFDDAIDELAAGRVRVEPMISARYPLGDGLRAFDAAAKRENVKVLIEMPN